MFTPEQRERIRAEILEAARADARISSGAITGSASVDRQDQWSDIDLAFGVRRADDVESAMKDFTELAFVAQDEFGPRAPTFKLVFGTA